MAWTPRATSSFNFSKTTTARKTRFYIIAILFVIFEVETIFLFPWAVQYTGWIPAFKFFGMVEMGVFLGILLVGYIWIYKKGALEWI